VNGPVVVLCDHDRGLLAEASLEALTFGRELAFRMGLSCQAVLIGKGAEKAASQLHLYGAEAIHIGTHDLLTDFGPEAWGTTLAQLVSSIDAIAAIASGTDRGNEVLAHMAAQLNLPFVANCVVVEPADSVWSLTRIQWGGSLLEDSTLLADCKVFSVAHHSIEAQPVEDPTNGDVVPFLPELDALCARTIVTDRVVVSQGMTLSTAPIVLGGGRGVGSADGFACLEDLATELQGVVGCSRAVTNNGWRPHSDQVGQTGTRIAPQIYIASGISGAIQHWVGAMASKHILAINTDREANMVARADWAVIGDLHKVVPAITEEIRRRRG